MTRTTAPHAGAWVRRNAIALLALFVALGGTGYAATAINGKQIQNGTIPGKKLKRNTLSGTQVNESKLAKVPAAGRADSAGTAGSAARATTAGDADFAQRAASAVTAASAGNADTAGRANFAETAGTATSATSATSAQTAATLGSFAPADFARASQFVVRGPFETDAATGTDQTFFSYPEMSFALETTRGDNTAGIPGYVQIQHPDQSKRIFVHVRAASFESAGEYFNDGINYPVNNEGADDGKDFLEITVMSLDTDLVVHIECLADDSVADIPVTCVATRSRP